MNGGDNRSPLLHVMRSGRSVPPPFILEQLVGGIYATNKRFQDEADLLAAALQTILRIVCPPPREIRQCVHVTAAAFLIRRRNVNTQN